MGSIAPRLLAVRPEARTIVKTHLVCLLVHDRASYDSMPSPLFVRRSPNRREPTIAESDQWVSTDRGTVFARAWVPSDRLSDPDATILLVHDSLGCLELWRDFPARLAAATCRAVIACDRLGFGQSDPTWPAPAELRP